MYDIKVLADNISNFFLTNQCSDKFCFKEGTESKNCMGMWVIIICALYGVKSYGAFFRLHHAKNLQKMEFKPKFAKRNVCICKNLLLLPQELNDYEGSGTGTDTTVLRMAPNPSNSAPKSGTPYYRYICTWVEYFLTVLHNVTTIIRNIGSM